MTDSARDEMQTYRDHRYCCMNCGCVVFEQARGPKDRCASCGALRDTKRGPENV